MFDHRNGDIIDHLLRSSQYDNDHSPFFRINLTKQQEPLHPKKFVFSYTSNINKIYNIYHQHELGNTFFFGKFYFLPKTGFSNPHPDSTMNRAISPRNDLLRRNGRTVFFHDAPRHGPRLRCYHLTDGARKRKKKTWEIPWKSETAKWWGIKKTSQKFGELDLIFFCGEFVPSKCSFAGRNTFMATRNNGVWEILLPHLIVD